MSVEAFFGGVLFGILFGAILEVGYSYVPHFEKYVAGAVFTGTVALLTGVDVATAPVSGTYALGAVAGMLVGSEFVQSAVDS